MNTVFIVVALALAGSVAQQKPAAKTPQKGDAIVVKGCLRGGALESTETGLEGADSPMLTAFVYRLTGDKGKLKELRRDHDGMVVEVTGTLKSNLPPDDNSRTFGNSRVRIGIGSPAVGAQAAEARRSIPVLEVKRYEGAAVKCGG
jgi:hypothetical protein